MILKKNIHKAFYLFLFLHLSLWTLIPSLTNTNLPLDTIEALAWGSSLDWGFSKHPPLSAFAVEFFFSIFGNNDWAYYLLSQIFVLIAFYFVWKASNELLEDKLLSLLSVLLLSGIFFYNFSTPEFNVNVSQLPFWALSVYFFWRGINLNKNNDESDFVTKSEKKIIFDLIKEREEARKLKDYERADNIRDKLKEMNINIEDSLEGTKWIKNE